ncbi:MAG: hypothetical protein R3247_01715, partial [Rhodothermales bacterium]|nr:hypothetical protein [Rhodothermales bacterium]
GYQGYGDDYDDYGDDYYEEDYYEDDLGRPYFSVRSAVAPANFAVEPMSHAEATRYQTHFGADIQVRRETELVRVK